MDAKQIAERQIIERYLAGQLSEEDARAFEAYVEVHPEIHRNIEVVARMKAGLATLRKRGELGGLLAAKSPPWHRRTALLVAAAASVIVALILVVRPWSVDSGGALLAATLQELAMGNSDVPVLKARIALTRSRGIKPQVIAIAPDGGAIEVTLQLSAPDPTVAYSAVFSRLVGNSLEQVAESNNLHTNDAGDLVLFVRTESLREGNYLFRISTNGREPSEFALRVTQAR
jgi:hypothetical protein